MAYEKQGRIVTKQVIKEALFIGVFCALWVYVIVGAI